MKKSLIKLSILLFIQLFNSTSVAIIIDASTEILFSPYDKDEIGKRVIKLLDGAKEQILIASYWIFDNTIIQKLITLKYSGIKVHVIFDESTSNLESLRKELLRNEIITYIYPSKHLTSEASMHNKFMVIDDKIVWTGSANFTATALDPSRSDKNYETISIYYSNPIALQFINNFSRMEHDIAQLYITLIMEKSYEEIPQWMKTVMRDLKINDPNFLNFLFTVFEQSNEAEREKLLQFFPRLEDDYITTIGKHPIKPEQRSFLESENIEIPERTSPEEADKLITERLELIFESEEDSASQGREACPLSQ